MLNQTPLSVVPNPYLTLDNAGFPSGAARLDPAESAGNRFYIGARLAGVDILARRNREHIAAGLAPTLQVNHWEFDLTPTDIGDTKYHRGLLQQGVIFAAHERTHRKVFGSSKARAFVPPEVQIAKAREAVIADWKANHDGEEPAFVAVEAAAKAEAARATKLTKSAPPTVTPTTPTATSTAPAATPDTNR